MVRWLAIAALCAAGCAELRPPVTTVRTGPAADRRVARVVALPPACGTILEAPPTSIQAYRAPSGCPVYAVQGLDAALRSELAFRGLDVVDVEQINAITATRRETRSGGDRVRLDGVWSRFADAPRAEQQAILAALRADGIVTTRMWLAPHEVTVQLRLVTADDRALVWVRRCEVEIDQHVTDVTWLERATRCALDEGRR